MNAKINISKRYITGRGDIVVFDEKIQQDVAYRNQKHIPRCLENWANYRGVQMPINLGTRYLVNKQLGWSPASNLYNGVLMSKENSSGYILTWDENGKVIPSSIPPQLQPFLRDKTEADNYVSGFNIEEYTYTDISQYFKDRKESFRNLILKFKNLKNDLYNASKGIYVTDCNTATIRMHEFDALAKEISEVFKQDINAIYDMEYIDDTLFYLVSNEYNKHLEDLKIFNNEHINKIKLWIMSDKYGYVSMENINPDNVQAEN